MRSSIHCAWVFPIALVLPLPAFGDPAAAGANANTAAVTFPEPTANWVPSTHFTIRSAPGGGDVYYSGEHLAPVTATLGVPLTFPIGNVDITED